MKIICSVLLTLASSSCFAASTVSDFLDAISHNWSGSGTVKMNIGGNQGTYKIKITQSGQSLQSIKWNITTKIVGMPSVSTTVSGYQLKGNDLLLSTPQYTEPTEIRKTSASELSYVVNHVDSVTGASVELTRAMEIDSTGNLHVLADVIQNGTLVEHFDYVLKK